MKSRTPKLLALSTLAFCAMALSQLLLDGLLPAGLAKLKSKGANTAEPAANNFDQGVARFRAHDFDGAIDSFLQSTYFARNGYDPEAYFWLGKSYMAKHDDVKAIEAFKKHIAQNMKKTPQGHCYLAEVYLRDNKDEEADNEAKLALTDAMGPCPEAHLILAKLLVKHGGYSNAEMQFLEALGDHPWKYTDAWMCYCESKMKAKDFTGANELLEKMIEAKGRLDHIDLPKIYLDMGVCHLARGDDQGAIDNFHKTLEIDPDNSAAHMELGILFEKEQHFSSAIKEYTAYCASAAPEDPKVPLAKERILKLEQKISSQNAPAVVAPSPYMRQQQEQQVRQRQQQQIPKDPGF